MWRALRRRAAQVTSAMVLAGAVLAMNAGNAEARLFEPQRDWWHAGRTCVASRNPPGRRWQVLPPRSCGAARVANVSFAATSEPVVDKPDFAEPKPPMDAMIVVALKSGQNAEPSVALGVESASAPWRQ